MNLNKKLLRLGAMAMVSAMSVAAVVPAVSAFGATNTKSVIEQGRKGTLNIHKIIENDGTLKNADGTKVEGDYVEVDNVGFDYVRIADIQNVTGILVSRDGDIDLDAGGGMVSVGAYYKANEKLERLFEAAGQLVPAVYLKTAVSGDDEATLQYQWADNKQNRLLRTEQRAVETARAALNQKTDALHTAQNEYYAASSELSRRQSNSANLQSALSKALDALNTAHDAMVAANSAKENARTASSTATAQATAAAHALSVAQNTFSNALQSYNSGDGKGLSVLKEANELLKTAAKDFKEAAESYSNASEALVQAEAAQIAAEQAKNAADAIMQAANDAENAAATGTEVSATGAQNAVTYAAEQLANAEAYLTAMNQAKEAAAAAKAAAQQQMEEANTALLNAQSKVNSVASGNTTAYNQLKESLTALTNAQNTNSEAQQAARDAADALDAATTALANALDQYNAAANAHSLAQTAAANASGSASAQESTVNGKQTALNNAQSAYDSALSAYRDAVRALDTKAEQNGILKYYTAEGLEQAMQKVITTLGEEKINHWVLENAPTQDDANEYSSMGFGEKTGQRSEGYTDDHGKVTFSGMDLGLYIVAETDISYHDGYAGAWNDSAGGGHINNDQMNTYDSAGGTYTITPLDGWNQEDKHTYAEGELYRESYNPEGPVLESLAAPFLVSIPTTNTTDTTNGGTGDNTGEAGTVWQYTIDVYPKNQSTGIYKRILDPDENGMEGASSRESLRTSEDYQIGDTISQVIWADAPVLQKNYLYDSSDEGFGDGVSGDVQDRPESNAENRHLGYVISDTMTKGLSFEGVTGVSIIPKYQLSGQNAEKTIYTDGNGTIVPESAALDHGQLKKTVKFYDDNDQEITKEMFEDRTGVSASSVQYKVDIDNTGTDVGTGTTYPAKSGLNQTDANGVTHYYATRISYKQIVIASGSASIPTTSDAFDVKAPVTSTEGGTTSVIAGAGETLEAGVDYEVISDLTTQQVSLQDFEGNQKVVVPMITDGEHHGFAVKLTEAGLEKLNARTEDSIIVVFFDSILNKDATIGQVYQNMNYPTLNWVNTNSSFREIRGNEVYDYTYELQLQKKGVTDGHHVKFIISRDDNGDFAQSSDKDLTDTVSRVKTYGADDSIRFVKEADGVYHVWGYLSGAEESDLAADGAEGGPEVSLVNGTHYYTVTPAEDGKLVLKGLDSNDYTFKEIQTEDENNLLKESFTVSLRAKDNTAEDSLSSLRDGRIATATVKTKSGAATDITVGVAGVTDGQDIDANTATNLGIAAMEVNNFDAIDLRTGGRGTTLLYIIGGLMTASVGAGIMISRKKNNKADHQQNT